MCEVLIKVNFPHCQSSKIVKNGKKKNGSQNLLCRCCQKQFLAQYRYAGANPGKIQLIKRLLEKNSGIHDIEQVLQVSRKCILRNLCRKGAAITIQSTRKHNKSVPLDEVWSYVGKRKKSKYWLLYASSPQADEVLAYVCGSRSAKTVHALLKKLQDVEIACYCSDYWKAFTRVLPADKH